MTTQPSGRFESTINHTCQTRTVQKAELLREKEKRERREERRDRKEREEWKKEKEKEKQGKTETTQLPVASN